MSRTKGNYTGDLGELEAAKELLRTGGAINSLTQSDYGWDLHLRLPRELMVAPRDSPWELSNRAISVQVKYKGYGQPDLELDQVEGWLVSGGVITFLIVVGPQGVRHFASPSDLERWAESRRPSSDEDDSLPLSQVLHRWNVREFGALAHVWTERPLLMSYHGAVIEAALRAGRDGVSTAVEKLISDVVLGFRAFSPPVSPGESLGPDVNDAAQAWLGRKVDDDQIEPLALGVSVDEAQSGGDAGIAPALYSGNLRSLAARGSAITLLEELGAASSFLTSED